MTTTFTQWEPSASIDPDSVLGRTINSLSKQWEAAKKLTTDLQDNITKRYGIYELHSGEASKISLLRQQRALEFASAREELVHRIKGAGAEVREEIARDRAAIKAAYHAKTARLRFWNVIKRTKAFLAYGRQLAGHKIKLVAHPVSLRTLRKKSIYRATLRAHADHFLQSDAILRQAHRAHMREAWVGPFRQSVGRQGPQVT